MLSLYTYWYILCVYFSVYWFLCIAFIPYFCKSPDMCHIRYLPLSLFSKTSLWASHTQRWASRCWLCAASCGGLVLHRSLRVVPQITAACGSRDGSTIDLQNSLFWGLICPVQVFKVRCAWYGVPVLPSSGRSSRFWVPSQFTVSGVGFMVRLYLSLAYPLRCGPSFFCLMQNYWDSLKKKKKDLSNFYTKCGAWTHNPEVRSHTFYQQS